MVDGWADLVCLCDTFSEEKRSGGKVGVMHFSLHLPLALTCALHKTCLWLGTTFDG